MGYPCRAFVAIPIPTSHVEVVQKCALSIENQAWDFYSWSYRKGLHLTLYFLGEISEETEIAIISSLGHVEWNAFSINLDKLLLMPEPEVPKILSAAVGGDSPALLRLQQAIHDRVFSAEVYKETRRYLPHITFGRIKRDKPTRARVLKRAIAGAILEPNEPWEVHEFYLYRSTVNAAGNAEHEVAATFTAR